MESDDRKVVRLEVKELVKDEIEVGFDSVMAVLAYLYNSEIKELPKGVCVCADDECFHIACRPAVDSLLQLLYLSHTFQIPELVALYQVQLNYYFFGFIQFSFSFSFSLRNGIFFMLSALLTS